MVRAQESCEGAKGCARGLQDSMDPKMDGMVAEINYFINLSINLLRGILEWG